MDAKIIFIAAACHNVNRGYCLAIGDTSQPTWDEAPDNIKASAIAGVKMHLANPNATPEESHAAWKAHKLAEGWKFGPVKDMAAKAHPCLVEYHELPPVQRVKDYLFKATVATLAQLPEDPLQTIPLAKPTEAQAAAGAVVATPQGFLPVKYVGRREHYIDGAYGTKLPFTKGQTRLVPRAVAVQMLKHADVYVLGKVEDTAQGFVAAQVADTKKADDEQQDHEVDDAHRAVSTMNRKQLANYARINFNQQMDPEQEEVGEMRAKVKRMIDQFGLPGASK